MWTAPLQAKAAWRAQPTCLTSCRCLSLELCLCGACLWPPPWSPPAATFCKLAMRREEPSLCAPTVLHLLPRNESGSNNNSNSSNSSNSSSGRKSSHDTLLTIDMRSSNNSSDHNKSLRQLQLQRCCQWPPSARVTGVHLPPQTGHTVTFHHYNLKPRFKRSAARLLCSLVQCASSRRTLRRKLRHF